MLVHVVRCPLNRCCQLVKRVNLHLNDEINPFNFNGATLISFFEPEGMATMRWQQVQLRKVQMMFEFEHKDQRLSISGMY